MLTALPQFKVIRAENLKNYVIDQNKGEISLTSLPHTDLWQRTYYHFRNDNAPLLQFNCEEEFFSFSVKCSFDYQHRFDQCGIVLYLDSENWLKASIEYECAEFNHLGSVVTNQGYSDWATAQITNKQNFMYYRLSRRGADFCIENSFDGKNFAQMRICHLHEVSKRQNAKQNVISCGIYACSPEESSFTAHFSEFSLGPCLWKAHDGQAPDLDI